MPLQSAVQELRQIPFEHLIGAPMKAAIEAQALAARTTVDFIHDVGFKHDAGGLDDLFRGALGVDADAGEVRNVTFEYNKRGVDGTETSFKLAVPILTIVPIPYIRIDNMSIDFKAKLTDSIAHKDTSALNVNVNTSARYSSFFSPVKLEMRVSSTYNTTTTNQSASQREYNMDIHVHAVQDEMPAGLAKILSILHDAITEQPKAAGGGG